MRPLRDATVLDVGAPTWSEQGDRLVLAYAAGGHRFEEVIDFARPIESTPFVERVTDLLAVAAGVSYYKVIMPGAVVADPGVRLTTSGRALITALYDQGLRECAFTNDLAVPVPTTFEIAEASAEPTADPIEPRGLMVPFGGGRDSTLVASVLAPFEPILFTVGSNRFSTGTARLLALDLHTVERTISPELLALNRRGALNGHIPVTAINSLIATLASESLGCDHIVMANEAASSSPTMVVDGVEINHQFSKSAEFEQHLDRALADTGRPVRYYSALRPWGDAEIGRAFSTLDDDLQSSFMSCNRAFVRDPAKRARSWCGECPKCLSVFLSMAGWTSPARLSAFFGRDLLADPDRTAGFRELVAVGERPFECVSDTEEAQRQLGRLLDDENWRDHPVVVALAPHARTDAGPPAHPERRSRIPAAVLEAMSKVLDG